MVKPIEGPASQPAPSTPAPAQNSSTVKQGETFSQFAKRNNVAENDLKSANPGVDPAKVQAGMELKLPESKPKAESSAKEVPASYAQPQTSTALKAEHSMEGQARAASLQAGITGAPASSPGTTGTPGGTTGTGSPTGTPASGTGTPGGPAATGTTRPPEQPTLKSGKKGPEVEDFQKKLNEYRTDQGQKEIKPDGKYGDETSKAVTDFQKKTGLNPDGDAGPRVQDRLKMETDPNFKSLKPEMQDKFRDLMGKYSTQPKGGKDVPENQDARTNLLGISTDPNFAKLSPEGQQKALDRFNANPSDAANTQAIKDTVKDRSALENNANFQKLNDDTKKQTLESLENFHGKAAERKNLSDLATNPGFSQLSRDHQDKTIKAFEKNPADAAYTKNLQDLTGGPNFRGMPDAQKTRVLDMASANAANPKYNTDLNKLVNHAEFGKLSAADQKKALNVFENTTPTGREALQKLMDRKIDGQPALTSKGYGKTGSTLDQLDRFTTTNLDARLTTTGGGAVDKKKVTEQLLQELSNPDFEINQHNRGTCTVTATTHRLAAQNPAEYARLVTDLATTGQSKLANGDTIQVPGGDSWQQDNSNRSHGERLLQSSLMSYGRPGKTYQNWNPGADGVRGTADDGFADPTNPANRSIDGFPDRNGSGLTSDELKRVLSGMHGREFDTYDGSWNFRDDKVDMRKKIEDQIKDGKKPTHVDISWGSGGAHALEVSEIKDGRVYFRNPWGGGNIGPTGQVNGSNANNTGAGPTRRVEDGNRGLESMTVADFEKHVLRVYTE